MKTELTSEDRYGGLPSLSEITNKFSKEELRNLLINEIRKIKAIDPEKAESDAKKLNIDIELI